jgi:hypothetical protein
MLGYRRDPVFFRRFPCSAGILAGSFDFASPLLPPIRIFQITHQLLVTVFLNHGTVD